MTPEQYEFIISLLVEELWRRAKPEQWTDNFDFLCSRCEEYVTPERGFECPKCHYTLIARQERTKK